MDSLMGTSCVPEENQLNTSSCHYLVESTLYLQEQSYYCIGMQVSNNSDWLVTPTWLLVLAGQSKLYIISRNVI